MPKISRYVTIIKVKYRDNYKNNKLTSFCIDDEKLLEKFEAIWTKIKALKNIELYVLPAYYVRYIKTKIRTYGVKVYTKLWLKCARR